MRCPFCGSEDSQVKDSRSAEDGHAIRRRRLCNHCDGRFTTFERIQMRDLVVIKKTGKKVAFDRDKLTRSFQIALRKRPVDIEEIDYMVSKLIRDLESSGESEISSDKIGMMVMELLSKIDSVGYVRYASVYKNFRATDDFKKFIGDKKLKK